ncbi:DUF2612 domain-containing protein [Francisella tularensis]|uniref:DUF2612 domain-containing protein n=1 Tax=Francisella tularensis TaxID=263 RepID=UPI0008F468BB|nr:DUF2612 domain-containing protein [Francisella tularensis]APA83229.1 hypothetical protein N894_1245 [Francisella tularensis subsp. novicida PA10-7858]
MSIYIQYQKATKFKFLLESLTEYLTIKAEDFHRDYFDLFTCKAEGLDNWGRILKVSRAIDVLDFDNIFGFDTAADDDQFPMNFDNGVFYGVDSNRQSLNDEDYRILLIFRYLSFVLDKSIKSCNHAVNIYTKLKDKNYKGWIENKKDEVGFIYRFNYTLSPVEITLFKYMKILPCPAGVDYDVHWE